MKHIRNYAKVSGMIDDYYESEIRKTEGEIVKLETEGVPEGSLYTKEDRISGLRKLLVKPVTLKNGKTKYPKSGYYRWWHVARERLDAADRAGEVTEITFKIEWKKSKTWGMCPSCETWVRYEGAPQDKVMVRNVDTGKRKELTDANGDPYWSSTHHNPRTYASGCGYDKRSTVMSDGMQCPAVDRLVIEHEKSWKCYAVEDKTSLPVLRFGGKGPETLRQLFVCYGEKPPIPGFEWTWEEGKTWDYIHIVRKAKGKRK